ncbi:helix-turn-helix domain-containing protein [Streptomyces sp. NPDC015492]|uniref:helix-turn-helix domain-containing protein n=1 Tax=Streptomyces sp. NPDC015492 TaxID=3364958 RepID=UPI0036FE6FF0
MTRPSANGAPQPPFAALARHLRALRRAARLPQRGLAEAAHVSRGAVLRLESGTAAPTMAVLDACLRACRAGAADQAKARRLLVLGRTAQRGKLPGLKAAPPLDFIKTKGELAHALVVAYERAGAPSLSDARLTPGRKPLPRTTAWRAATGKGLPATTEQLITFLTACGIGPERQRRYVDAYVRVVAQRGAHRLPPQAQRTPLIRGVHPVPLARGGTDTSTRYDLTALASVVTAIADSVPRVDFDALAPGLAIAAERLAPLSRLVRQDAQRNGTALPGLALALAHFAELNRAVVDSVLTADTHDTDIDVITRTGDGTVNLYQAKRHGEPPGPPPALSGPRVPPPPPGPLRPPGPGESGLSAGKETDPYTLAGSGRCLF